MTAGVHKYSAVPFCDVFCFTEIIKSPYSLFWHAIWLLKWEKVGTTTILVITVTVL